MCKCNQLVKPIAHCSKSYLPCRLRCPICGLYTTPRQNKIKKNPSQLWWHIANRHPNFICSKFSADELCVALNGVSKALELGMLEEN